MNRVELAEQILINIVSSYSPNDLEHLNADVFDIADAFIAEAEKQEQPKPKKLIEVGCRVIHDDADIKGEVISYIPEYCKWQVLWADGSESSEYASNLTRIETEYEYSPKEPANE